DHGFPGAGCFGQITAHRRPPSGGAPMPKCSFSGGLNGVTAIVLPSIRKSQRSKPSCHIDFSPSNGMKADRDERSLPHVRAAAAGNRFALRMLMASATTAITTVDLSMDRGSLRAS